MSDPLMSSKSEHWMTPSTIVDKVYKYYNDYPAFDPCGHPSAIIKAHKICYPEHTYGSNIGVDGLSSKWENCYFMNPPYGRAISDWINKAIDEYDNNNVRHGLILAPARTDTNWFNDIIEYAACWCTIKGRLKFQNPYTTDTASATFPSVIILISEDPKNVATFIATFADIGKIWIDAHK